MPLPPLATVLKNRVLDWVAPEGSLVRTVLRAGVLGLEHYLPRHLRPSALFRTPFVHKPLNVYDARAVAAFTRDTAVDLVSWDPATAERSELGAARMVLGVLRDRPDLRLRFPRAIRDGATGAYCHWLCAEGNLAHALSPAAVENVRGAFRRRFGERVRQAYDHFPQLRDLFPLALTPAGRRPFLRWLIINGKPACGLQDEEIWWFLYECAEDPSHGVVATYLRQPHWQEQVPDGLTIFGRERLLSWIESHYRIRADWLKHIEWPLLSTPADELRLLHLATPDLQTVAPRAFEDEPDTTRLLDWVRTQTAPRAALDQQWYDRLAADEAEGKLVRPGVNVLAHFCHPSGLQEAASTTVRALQAQGMQTSCRDLPCGIMKDLLQREQYMGLELFDQTILFEAPEPNVPVMYASCGLTVRPDVYRIAVWFWELETIPPSWVKYARMLQEIWAPTQFIARAMRAIMPLPVVDMLPGADLGTFPQLPRTHFGLPPDKFLFFFSFDMSSVMERKNPLGLIRAFQQAFGADPRVALVIKVTRGSADPDGLARLLQAARSVDALVIDRILSRPECNALMNVCDCYVSLHRSEGFGYTMAEAMLMGKPVIATGYSGNVDFMTPTNSLLVDYDRVPIAQSLPFYPVGSVWADPHLDHAAELMSWVYQNPDEARRLGLRAQGDTSRLLSLEALGQRMAKRLQDIRRARRGPSAAAA